MTHRKPIFLLTVFGVLGLFGSHSRASELRLCGSQAVRGISCKKNIAVPRYNMQGQQTGTVYASRTVFVACGSNKDTHMVVAGKDSSLDPKNAEAVGFSKVYKFKDSGRDKIGIYLASVSGKWKARLFIDPKVSGREDDLISGSLTEVREYWLSRQQTGLVCSFLGNWDAKDAALELFAGVGQNGHYEADSAIPPIPGRGLL